MGKLNFLKTYEKLVNILLGVILRTFMQFLELNLEKVPKKC